MSLREGYMLDIECKKLRSVKPKRRRRSKRAGWWKGLWAIYWRPRGLFTRRDCGPGATGNMAFEIHRTGIIVERGRQDSKLYMFDSEAAARVWLDGYTEHGWHRDARPVMLRDMPEDMFTCVD